MRPQIRLLRIYESRTSDLVQMTRAVSGTPVRSRKVTTIRGRASERSKSFFIPHSGKAPAALPCNGGSFASPSPPERTRETRGPRSSCRIPDGSAALATFFVRASFVRHAAATAMMQVLGHGQRNDGARPLWQSRYRLLLVEARQSGAGPEIIRRRRIFPRVCWSNISSASADSRNHPVPSRGRRVAGDSRHRHGCSAAVRTHCQRSGSVVTSLRHRPRTF